MIGDGTKYREEALERQKEAGGCGMITMTANGKKLAEGRLERTIPVAISLGEGLDIGMDVGSPVDFSYKLPFSFTGNIEKVTIDLKREVSSEVAAA